MRLPQLSRTALLGIGLVLTVGTGAGVAVVAALDGPTGNTSSLSESEPALMPSETPSETSTPPSTSPTTSATPSPSAKPTVTMTFTPTPSRTRAPVATRAASPTPSPSPTAHPQTITVSVAGPTDVVEGVEYVYTFRTTWDHERPRYDIHSFSNSGGLPASDGCTPPKEPPAHDRPGSTSGQVRHTWTTGPAVTNIQMRAFSSCQWYSGGDAKIVDVKVRPAPTPSPSPTPPT